MKKSDFLPKVDLLESFIGAIDTKKSKPWDNIIDYATHRSFCGNSLYPRQETLLKLMYLETEIMTAYDIDVINQWSESFANKAYTVGVQEDIWERVDHLKKNGYDHFRQVQGVMGRRASKGHMGGIAMSERISSLVAMDNPQEFFGIEKDHDIYSLVIATTGTQAQKFLFADLLSQVRKNVWLRPYVFDAADHSISVRTPADIRRTATLIANGIPPRKPLASIKSIPVSSNSGSNRGGAVISAGFDEFAFTLGGDGSRSGNAMYSAIEPSLDQFGKEAFIYMPSSPWSKVGKFFELYENGSILLDEYLHRQGKLSNRKNKAKLEEEILEDAIPEMANPEMLIVQLESWGLYLDYDKSPVLLSKPHPLYDKRKKTSNSVIVKTEKDEKIHIVGKNALGISDSFMYDNSIYTISDTLSPELTLGNIKVVKTDDIKVVVPGPEFKSPIQTEPDREGSTSARSMAIMESRDPNLFRVERRGQFLSTQNAYLDPNKVAQIFEPFWDDRKLDMVYRGKAKHDYYLHADPSKVGADFAVMIAHTEQSPEPDTDGAFYKHLIVDYYHVYQPKDFTDGEIDYLLVIKDLKTLIDSFPTMRSLTMDQFNSVMPIQSLRKYAKQTNKTTLNIHEQTFTAKWNSDMWKALKAAINLGWIHTPTDNFFKGGKGCLLEQELNFLEEVNGKVVKGDNIDVRHDDLVDCLGTLVVKLLGSQLEENNKMLESLSLTGAVKAEDKAIFHRPRGVDDQNMSPHDRISALYDRDRFYR